MFFSIEAILHHEETKLQPVKWIVRHLFPRRKSPAPVISTPNGSAKFPTSAIRRAYLYEFAEPFGNRSLVNAGFLSTSAEISVPTSAILPNRSAFQSATLIVPLPRSARSFAAPCGETEDRLHSTFSARAEEIRDGHGFFRQHRNQHPYAFRLPKHQRLFSTPDGPGFFLRLGGEN